MEVFIAKYFHNADVIMYRMKNIFIILLSLMINFPASAITSDEFNKQLKASTIPEDGGADIGFGAFFSARYICEVYARKMLIAPNKAINKTFLVYDLLKLPIDVPARSEYVIWKSRQQTSNSRKL